MGVHPLRTYQAFAQWLYKVVHWCAMSPIQIQLYKNTKGLLLQEVLAAQESADIPGLMTLGRNTSSTTQGGGGSFKNRKPIGEVGCCESRMAERSHWWIERWLMSPLFLSLPVSFSDYLPTYLSMYQSLSLSLSVCLSVSLSISLSIYLSIYLATSLSLYLSISLSIYLSISLCLSIYLPIYLPIHPSIHTYLSIYLPIYLPIYLAIYLSIHPSIHLSVYLSLSLALCLSIYLQAWKRSYSARLLQFLSLTTSKTNEFCENSSFFELDNIQTEAILRDFLIFWNWQHQKRSNSARLPSKMESWLQSWRPRANAFCYFSSPSV